MIKAFRKEFTLEQRIHDSNSILSKHPDKVPVIIDSKDQQLLQTIKKRKFLVPRDISASYLLITIRNKIKLDSSKALFMFTDDAMINGTSIIGESYEDYKKSNKLYGIQTDKFFYITIAYETTFG